MVKEYSFPKLDLGCGQVPREGFTGVDIVKTGKAVIACNLMQFPWVDSEDSGFATGSVEEVHCSHFFEHVPGPLRMAFMDELYRVLKDNAKATFITPYYSSMRAVQDPTHAWPPICEATYLYFNKSWRDANKLDHYPVSCDFDFTYGYAIDPTWAVRAHDAQAFGLKHYMNTAGDIQVTLTKRPRLAA